jgi:hypothetical protein
VVAPGVLSCGRWSLVALCGAYGGNAMIDSLRTKERTIEDLISFFFHSLYSWSAAFLAPLTFSFNDFLVLFSTSS